MLIRTQDRMGLIDISGMRIKAEVGTDGCAVVAYSSYYQSLYAHETLGKYGDKERAIEILDDIARSYTRMRQAQVSGPESVSLPKFVYDMPER